MPGEGARERTATLTGSDDDGVVVVGVCMVCVAVVVVVKGVVTGVMGCWVIVW